MDFRAGSCTSFLALVLVRLERTWGLMHLPWRAITLFSLIRGRTNTCPVWCDYLKVVGLTTVAATEDWGYDCTCAQINVLIALLVLSREYGNIIMALLLASREEGTKIPIYPYTRYSLVP